MKKGFCLIGLFLLVSIDLLFAGVTGKIAGTVTDADTGEKLTGVNVYLEGTTIGAASDVNGYYVILNVPPDTYTLIASMIGYEKVEVTNVVVAIDLTTTINVELHSTVLGIGEVTVEAKRPVVVPDISNSMVNIRSETIESLPVVNITQVVGLLAGIQGMSIRGSGAYQTAFLVDGLSLVDERAYVPFTSITLSSIQEIQVQTGVFSAEYGDARSGVITVVTKEGNRDKYSGVATYRYSPPAPKHFGPSIYDPNTYFTRPYMDPEVCWTGTKNGAWDTYKQRQYVSFAGYNFISETLLQDDDPTNDLTPTAAQWLYAWEHRRKGDIIIPDYTIDFGLGGPVPGIGRKLGNLRFYLSHRTEQDAFVFPLSRDAYGENMSQLKLTSDLSPSTKLTLSGMYGEISSVCPYQWQEPPTGDYLRSDYSLAIRGKSIAVLYIPGYYNPTTIYRGTLGANLVHALSERTFYELSLQVMRNKYDTYRTRERDLEPKYEIVDGYFTDEAPFGYYGYDRSSFIDGMTMGGWMGFARDWSVNTTTTFRGDLTSQVNELHLIKTGVKVVYNDFRIHSALESPVRKTWSHYLDWDRFPYRVGAYINDKIEIEQMIANVGVHFDYSDANGDWYDFQPYDPFLTAEKGNIIEEEAPTLRAKPVWALSPRLGVSHPITVNSKLYFNYGHLRSLPRSPYLYKLDRMGVGNVYRLGDPNLPYSKTVAYELGFEQNILNRFLLRLAAYYKDITEQPSWTKYLSASYKVNYSMATVDNYEDIRGLEITLDMRPGGWLSGFINYTYQVNTSGYFGYRYYYEDPGAQREYVKLNPYQSKPRPQPYARANINIHTPDTFGPKMMGLYPVGGWYVNLLATWSAGSFATYNPANMPGVLDNVQWKDSRNADLRFSKTVTTGKFDVDFFIDVTNLFNTKIMSYAGFSGSTDYNYYMESLHFDWGEGPQHGSDRVGEVRQTGVDFVPMETVSSVTGLSEPNQRVLYYDSSTQQYMRYPDGAWMQESDQRVQEILDTKAYIDMPNLPYFTFLNPRDITLGFRISF